MEHPLPHLRVGDPSSLLMLTEAGWTFIYAHTHLTTAPLPGGSLMPLPWQHPPEISTPVTTGYHCRLVLPPGSAVPGILQARTLEWLAISFSDSLYECTIIYVINLYL